LSETATDRLGFRILGPVEVAANGERLALGGEKQRALLAILLLHRNEVVSRDRLIDELWGDRPPPTAAAALNVYISKLRKTLGAAGAHEILVTREPGYLLQLEPGQLDAERFRDLAAAGRSALDAGDFDEASTRLRAALELWRGHPLGDLRDEEFARAAGARLEEERLAALMDRIDAELARGETSGLVGDLETLVTEHPFQERLWADLMRALYLDGRQAEALEAYKRARMKLDELGIEPRPELKRLQSQILRQDPALRVPRAPQQIGPKLPRSRQPALLVLAGAFVLAIATGIAILLTHDGSRDGAPIAIAPNSVRVIDLASNRALKSVPIGGTPGGLSMDNEAVWVANEDDDTLLRIDPATMDVVQTIGATGVTDVAAGAGALWAITGDGAAVLRIRPDHPDLSRAIRIERLTGPSDPANVGRSIAFGAGSVWTLNGRAGLARIDPTSGDLLSRIPLTGNSPDEVAFGAGSLWIADWVNRQLIEVDPKTERVVGRTTVGKGPGSVAVGFGSVWVIDYVSSVVWRFNPLLEQVERSIPVGDTPGSVVVGAGFVWVANNFDSTVTKIDPTTNRAVGTIHVGYEPTRIVVGHGKLWVITR
jgi:YVTN family beta-propeller protein